MAGQTGEQGGAVAAGWPRGGMAGTTTKIDQQFKGLETLLSVSIAADRGGNERRVNVSKRRGYIERFPTWDGCLYIQRSLAVLVFSGQLHV